MFENLRKIIALPLSARYFDSTANLLQGIAEGKAEGETKASNKIALNMLSSNISVELVAQFTGLTLKQVQKLQKLAAQKSKMPKSSKPKRSPKT